MRKWTLFLHKALRINYNLKSWEFLFLADLWFRASKMATRELDPSHCFKNWRDFWVCCDLPKWLRVVHFCNFELTQFSIMTAQLSCSWILASWDSGWENRCICLWCSAIRISHRETSTWSFTTKPCFVGMLCNSTK